MVRSKKKSRAQGTVPGAVAMRSTIGCFTDFLDVILASGPGSARARRFKKKHPEIEFLIKAAFDPATPVQEELDRRYANGYRYHQLVTRYGAYGKRPRRYLLDHPGAEEDRQYFLGVERQIAQQRQARLKAN